MTDLFILTCRLEWEQDFKYFSNKISQQRQLFLFMTSSSDYLDRLKSIRDKYGCGQPKTYTDYQTSAPERPTLGYQKPETTYALEKKKYAEGLSSGSGLTHAKNTEYSARPQSSIGLSSQGYGASQNYAGASDYSRKAEREREIEQIRENYAASRRKVVEDFSSKTYTRDFSKELPARTPAADYTREYSRQAREDLRNPELHYPKQTCSKVYVPDYRASREYRERDYSRQRRDQFKTLDNVAKYTRSSRLQKPEESVSPIKRVSELEERKSYRQTQAANDIFWREREAKLSELTAARLNQNTRMSLLKEDKLGSAKRSGLFAGEGMKNYPEMQGLGKMDSENKPTATDYSVNNIDRIQQRIQSILGRK